MTSFEPVKTESCKNCGSTVKQYSSDSLTIICNHCGTNTSTTSKSPKEASKKYKTPKNPLFKLHQTFEYDSRVWQIIGCISYKGIVREWDSEDNVWETNPWKYNSWWVINEARELAWLTHDSTGYKWSRKTTLKSSIPSGNRTYEEGNWSIDALAGEFSYFPSLGAMSKTYEKGSSSIEVRYDSTGAKKEIESFISTPIKPMAILKAFNKTNILNDLERFKLAKKAIIVSLICLSIGYFFLTQRTDNLLTIKNIPIQAVAFKDNIFPLGNITLDKESPVEFKLNARPARQVNGGIDANLIIKDDKDVKVSEIPISFWRTSGRDSDGSWVESAFSVSPRLKLPPNKRYQLSLKLEKINKWTKISLSGQIKKNVASLFPFIIGSLCLAVLLLLMIVFRSKFIQKHTGMK